MNLAAKKEDYIKINSQQVSEMDISWVEMNEDKNPIKEISYDR